MWSLMIEFGMGFYALLVSGFSYALVRLGAKQWKCLKRVAASREATANAYRDRITELQTEAEEVNESILRQIKGHESAECDTCYLRMSCQHAHKGGQCALGRNEQSVSVQV